MIATSAKVELKGIDEKTVERVGEEGYFTREKKQDKSGEEAFFKQGEKPEVRPPMERLAWEIYRRFQLLTWTLYRRRRLQALAQRTRRPLIRRFYRTSRKNRFFLNISAAHSVSVRATDHTR